MMGISVLKYYVYLKFTYRLPISKHLTNFLFKNLFKMQVKHKETGTTSYVRSIALAIAVMFVIWFGLPQRPGLPV